MIGQFKNAKEAAQHLYNAMKMSPIGGDPKQEAIKFIKLMMTHGTGTNGDLDIIKELEAMP